MQQIENPALQTRGEIQTDNKPFPEFSIQDLQLVQYGRIRAQFSLDVWPVLVECSLVVDEEGRPQFVAPQSVRDKFSGGYRSTVEFDRGFAREVFGAVVERLQAQE